MKICNWGPVLGLISILLMGCDNTQMGRGWVGVPYGPSPLGEGFGYDPDPLIRFDMFDCTTFVETVLARGNVRRLNQIRYANGRVDFINRNHFIETDWLQNNANRVENVSAQIAPTSTRRVTIDRAAWLRKMHGMDSDATPETVYLDYVPYSNIPDQMRPVRPMIVLFVTDGDGMLEKIGTDLAVTHMGFLLPDGTLRHASSLVQRVTDINFDEYVADRKKSRHNLGVIFLEIK